ncbi:MAG: hypothetical protein K5746_06340, partial [Clostridiales bacterium]|nr:hypothetical protein [Clostridiales bacterium]
MVVFRLSMTGPPEDSMADYSRYFPPAIWYRGQQYFREGRVQQLRPQSGEGRVFRAVVQGTRKYSVQVVFVKGTLNAMGCTCPVAVQGNACKHEAAVLLAIDAKERGGDPDFRISAPAKPALPEVVPVFEAQKEAPARDYRTVRPFFSIPRAFETMRVRKEDLDEARKIIADRTIVCERLDECASPYQGRLLRVEGLLSRPNRALDDFSFTVSRSQVTAYECSVRRDCYHLNHVSAGGKRLCCAHIAALAILADERLRESPMGSVTDAAGETLLAGFRRALPEREETAVRAPEVTLRPRIALTPESVVLNLKAGDKKLYVIRRLADFFAAERAAEPFAVSAKSDIDF